MYFLDQYAIQQSRHINYWANRRAHTGFVNHPVVVLGKEKDPDGGGIVWFKPCTSNPVRERHGFRQIGQPGVRRGDNILPLTHDTRDAMPKATFVDPRADIWVVEPSAIKPFIDNKKQSIIRLTAESVAILDRPYQRAEMMKEMSRPGYG